MTEVTIGLDNIKLGATILIPAKPTGLVLFAHGSGSSRKSPRNLKMAHLFNQTGMGAILLDLLTEEEIKVDEINQVLRFDVATLSSRLVKVTKSLHEKKEFKELPIGYYGASTGAAAALSAAGQLPFIKAVVSRGGRPDLALKYLDKVKAATLLIVGELDTTVLSLNERAYQMLTCEKKLTIIKGATHLFEEKGALETVAMKSMTWFQKHFNSSSFGRSYKSSS